MIQFEKLPAQASSEFVATGEYCPHCRGRYIYEARRRTLFERLLSSLGHTVRRCHRCSFRYLLVAGIPVEKRLA